MKFKRVLLKVSGEAISGEKSEGIIDEEILGNICANIKKAVEKGAQIGLVIGGGNIWRGRYGKKMDRTTSDHMGMLATIINALAFQTALEEIGVETRLQTSIEMRQIAEPYIRRRAVRHLEKGRVVIFAGGTGNPFFTTDTGAALRAAEIDAEAILLAKNVDGVYDSDPRENPNAKKYDRISYEEMIEKKLRALDLTAASLCMDNNIPIHVFEIAKPENILKVLDGEDIGTIIE
ncbi:MAG: UMP kinase [Clostridiales bacterium]|nr:UMP kinase [Clostridiales bacterium]